MVASEIPSGEEGWDFVQNLAKQSFIQAALTAFDPLHPCHDLLINSIQERLVETEAFKADFRGFDETLVDLNKKIESNFSQFYPLHQERIDQIFSCCPEEYRKLKSASQTSSDINEELMNCFQANYDELKQISFHDLKWDEIIGLKETFITLDLKRSEEVKFFAKKNFALYANLVESSSYYLSFNELKLAAEILIPPEVKVLVFWASGKDPLIIHPKGTASIIAIEHSIAYELSNQHFSRLERVQ